jgi:hypothetical protein
MTIICALYTERNGSRSPEGFPPSRLVGDGKLLDALLREDDPASSGVGRTSMAVWV